MDNTWTFWSCSLLNDIGMHLTSTKIYMHVIKFWFLFTCLCPTQSYSMLTRGGQKWRIIKIQTGKIKWIMHEQLKWVCLLHMWLMVSKSWVIFNLAPFLPLVALRPRLCWWSSASPPASSYGRGAMAVELPCAGLSATRLPKPLGHHPHKPLLF